MYSKGVSHRDLKIDNIFLDYDVREGTMKAFVGDFGIARSADDATPGYGAMYGPPELIYLDIN